MTDFKPEYLAQEATRLTNDQVLNYAIQLTVADALEGLASVGPTNQDEIRRLQADYKACQSLMTTLNRFILAVDDGSDDEGDDSAV